MRLIEPKNVMVGDWIEPRDHGTIRTNYEWPQQVTYVYKTAVGGQVRVKYNETPCGHSDAPALMFNITRRDKCD